MECDNHFFWLYEWRYIYRPGGHCHHPGALSLNQGTATDLKIQDDVIEWKHFPRYWPFVRRIHRSPVNSPHKGQWRGALMFSLICALSKQLSKHSWGWWFETPSRPSWCHCNDLTGYHGSTCLIGMPYCCNETCDSGDKAIWHTTALHASYMKSLICQK